MRMSLSSHDPHTFYRRQHQQRISLLTTPPVSLIAPVKPFAFYFWIRFVAASGKNSRRIKMSRRWWKTLDLFFSLCERKTNINYALRWFSCFHIFFEEKSIESRQDHAENKSIGPNLLSSSTSPGFTKKLRKFIYLFSASMFTHPHWAGVWCCVFASVIVGKIAVSVVVLLTRKIG